MTKPGGRSPKNLQKHRWALRLHTFQKETRVEDCRLGDPDLRVIHEEVERDFDVEFERIEPQTSDRSLLQRFICMLWGEEV